MELDTIVCMDALEYMRGLPDASVDLVVTSPPYNMGTHLNGAKPSGPSGNWNNSLILKDGYSDFNDAMPHETYVAWQRQILTECMRVVSLTGAVFYNHKWRIQGGLLDMRQDIVAGFPLRQIIVWNRGSSNNHNPAFFAPSYEVIYLFARQGFYLKQSATGFNDVWNIPPESGNPHPAPFPLALAERCITSTSARIILDPFMGSGTVGVAAKKHGRHYIGCDVSPEYIRQATTRIAKQPYTPPLFTADPAPADPPAQPALL